MKWKNSVFYNKLRFFFETKLFSEREYVVICFLSLIIALWNEILSLPSLAQWELTVWQDTALFSLFVLWQVITVCAFISIPFMSILGIILWWLLEKKTQKLKEINQQRGKITCQQKDRYKKDNRGKMHNTLVIIFTMMLMLVVIWLAFIPMIILELYYGVFKQVRMYCQLRKELKSVLKERDMVFEKS
ncbi:hypothetical protein [Bartonella gliris]|uniref:hypothetical protein n=1 Tax=Bartonella gliris TaxID=3004109 RepID=UPI00295EEF98|nr:hypothetical protein [Bartonella gliris]